MGYMRDKSGRRLDSMEVTEATSAPAIRLSDLPTFVNGKFNFNTGICNLTTDHNGVQHVVYWDSVGHPRYSKRTLPNGRWITPVDLYTTELGSADADGHNILSVGVDSLGYVHIAGNMHNDGLKTVRSDTPGGITFSNTTIIGTEEGQTTYPNFVSLSDGTLLLIYRYGSSGSGDVYIDRLPVGATTWQRVGLVVDGLSSGESPYFTRFAVDAEDNLHAFVTWRGSGQADTSNDYCYIKLTNLAGVVAAERANGTVQALPITHANCEVVIDTAASGSGVLNQRGCDVDTLGRPHGVSWLYDANGYTQYQHVWHDGSAWHNETVTDFATRIDMNLSILDWTLAPAQVVCTAAGRTYLIWRASYENRNGYLRGLDVTPSDQDTPGVPSEFVIAELDLAMWEPTFDARAARDRGELHMLIHPCISNGPTSRGYNADDNWIEQYGGVLSVDLRRMSEVAAGAAKRPRIVPLSMSTGPGSTVAATAYTDSGIQGAMIGDFGNTRRLFVRQAIRFRNEGTPNTLTVSVVERIEANNVRTARYVATLIQDTFSGTWFFRKATPWVPIKLGTDGTGWVSLEAKKSGSFNGTISIPRFDIGILEAEL